MTLIERDILAVLLSLNTVFMILALPNVIPIEYDVTGLTVTTLLWGLPLGAVGVALNHWAELQERRERSAGKRQGKG